MFPIITNAIFKGVDTGEVFEEVFQCLVINKTHLLRLCDEGMTLFKYQTEGDRYIVDNSNFVPGTVDIHIHNIGDPRKAINLDKISGMSLIEFFEYLITNWKDERYWKN